MAQMTRRMRGQMNNSTTRATSKDSKHAKLIRQRRSLHESSQSAMAINQPAQRIPVRGIQRQSIIGPQCRQPIAPSQSAQMIPWIHVWDYASLFRSVIQSPNAVPADEAFNCFVFGQAEFVVTLCGVCVAVFGSLPEFTHVSTRE